MSIAQAGSSGKRDEGRQKSVAVPCYSTRPIEGVYCSLRKSHSKSLRDGIFAVKLGFFAKKPRKTPRVSSRSVL